AIPPQAGTSPAEAPATSEPPAAAPAAPAPAPGQAPPAPARTPPGPPRTPPARPERRDTSDERRESRPVEIVKNGDMMLKLNFQDAPLQTVLEYLSETVGLSIVSGEPIAASRITVIQRQSVTLDVALGLINSMLKEKGLTALLQGKTLKVVTLLNAPRENTPVRIIRDVNDLIPDDSVVTCVIPVGHVGAAALVQNLQTLLPEYATLTANLDGNALIITDTTANIRRLMQIVKALDTHMATVAEIRVFRLKNADATSVATVINSIFQQQAQGNRGGIGGRGTFPTGNPFQMMMQMRGGPGGMGGMGGPRGQLPPGEGLGGGIGGGIGRGLGAGIGVVMSAAMGGSTRNQRGGFGGSSQTGSGNLNVQVVAAADTQTNSVVVRGPSDLLDLVADVIEALDMGTKVATVRVFQLRYADAMNTADVINQLFNAQSSSSSRARSGRGSSGFGGGPMMFRGPFGEGGPGGMEGDTGMVGVTAASDSRTNTVVVTGPESVLNVVEEVIKKLDTPLSNVADVKVFRLEYADASNTAQLINEVFGQSRTSSTSRTSRTSSQQSQQVTFRGGPGGMMGGQPGTQTTGTSSDIAVVASADTRTNSVVVSGPQETLEVIAQIIKELDENPAAERRIFVYPLKNANASGLMSILNNLFQQMQTLNQRVAGTRTTVTGGQRNVGAGMATMGGPTGGGMAGGTTSSSTGDTLSEETYFQADPNTNSLLVMTSSKNYEKVKPIIDELDKPVGQVLIKVLFAELTHSNNVDWGVEFSMLNLRSGGDSTLTSTAFPPVQTSGLAVRTLHGDL
ncbi:MAG: hypothetical protein FJ280_30050, partial [Planctomycetes bacterium]|nr:hypothetical protein [Planctomycetota bacterium]